MNAIPDRAVIERLGDELTACVLHGLVEVDEPERMPLPWQETVVRLCNELRAGGKPMDTVGLIELAIAGNVTKQEQREVLHWLETPDAILVKYYGPTGWDPVRLREAVFGWSEAARDCLLIEAAARHLSRGEYPHAEIARLKGGSK